MEPEAGRDKLNLLVLLQMEQLLLSPEHQGPVTPGHRKGSGNSSKKEESLNERAKQLTQPHLDHRGVVWQDKPTYTRNMLV